MPTEAERPKPDWLRLIGNPWFGPAAIAVAAVLATLLTLAPESGGPGITCDEPYHVAYGKRLVHAWRQQGLSFFTWRNIERNFAWKPGGPPVHPPLGNWILGWTHHLFDQAPNEVASLAIAPARFAPALAFGLLILIVGVWTAKAEGRLAGWVAAAAVALVPRLFAHAHLAALDMLTALFFVAAAIGVIWAETRGAWWRFALAGMVWGLAMLVRLHGTLLLPPVAVWLAWRLRRRVFVPFGAWLFAGIATLYAGWPWLWLAPLANLRQYLGSGIGRQAIQVFYLGQTWADHEVPRHYALVMFLVVLPLGLLLLGVLGHWSRRRVREGHPGYWLLVGSLAFVLLVFSMPGTPVYDGERLFLMVFPLWAVAVATGAKWLLEHRRLQAWPYGWRLAGLMFLVAGQGIGLALYHPFQLCHYSLLVGGLAGAERLGFEVDYWGVGLTENLLEEVAAHGRMDKRGPNTFIAPDLAPFHAPGVVISSKSLASRGFRPASWNPTPNSTAGPYQYGLFFRRRANLDDYARSLAGGEVMREETRQGVWIARFVRIPPVSRSNNGLKPDPNALPRTGEAISIAPRRFPERD